MRNLLRLLESKSSIPSVSIIMSTELKSFADKERLSLKLKQNIANAKTDMLKKFDAASAEEIEAQLNKLVASIDYRHLAKGIGLFASKDFSAKVDLPLRVEDKIIITEGFVTTDIKNIMDQLFDFEVLVLSRKESKLYEGFGHKLQEVKSNFPIAFEDDFQVSRSHPHSQYNNEESKIDQSRRDNYFRKIAKALNETNLNTPMILMGTIENRSDFKNVSKHKKNIIAEISGNMDKKSIPELSKMVWETLEKHVIQQPQN